MRLGCDGGRELVVNGVRNAYECLLTALQLVGVHASEREPANPKSAAA
jgi:hypothetical protein